MAHYQRVLGIYISESTVLVKYKLSAAIFTETGIAQGPTRGECALIQSGAACALFGPTAENRQVTCEHVMSSS